MNLSPNQSNPPFLSPRASPLKPVQLSSAVRSSIALHHSIQHSPQNAASSQFVAFNPYWQYCASPSLKAVQSPRYSPLQALNAALNASNNAPNTQQSPRTKGEANDIWEAQFSPFNLAQNQNPAPTSPFSLNSKASQSRFTFDSDSTDSESESDEETSTTVKPAETQSNPPSNAHQKNLSWSDFDPFANFHLFAQSNAQNAAETQGNSVGSTPGASPTSGRSRLKPLIIEESTSSQAINQPVKQAASTANNHTQSVKPSPKQPAKSPKPVNLPPSQSIIEQINRLSDAELLKLVKSNTEKNKYIAATPAELMADLDSPMMHSVSPPSKQLTPGKSALKSKSANQSRRQSIKFADDAGSKIAVIHEVPDDLTQYPKPKHKRRGKGEKPCRVM